METLARIIPPRLDYFGMLDDLARGSAFGKASARMVYSSYTDGISAYYIFERTAKRRANETAYIFEGQKYTWKETQEAVNRLAHYWIDQGFKRDDTVAFVMPNKYNFIVCWLSFMALGVQPAFINYNLTGDSLVHCIKVSEAKAIIFDLDCVPSVRSVQKKLSGLQLYVWKDGQSLVDAKGEAGLEKYWADAKWHVIEPNAYSQLSTATIPHKPYRTGLTWKDPVCFIYSSGSTGLPKAAPVSQAKVTTGSLTWSKFCQWQPNDIIYTCLPLYHSSAALLCVAAAWSSGSTVAISRKFSASKFWSEVKSVDATVIQYIGEICRYILSQNPDPEHDKDNKVRMAFGNGMRPDVFEDFKARFGIQAISEFYASTEGNTFLFNYNQSTFGSGAIGRESFLSKRLAGNYILKVDPDTQELWRNSKGFCEEAAFGEPGELLVSINEMHPAKGFSGYKGNKDSTNDKIEENVMKKGDKFFRTGDLLSRQPTGYYYFVDRLGDTFRWKSENVSTAEVTEALHSYDGLEEIAVYGVQLPKHDGRAGCAGIPQDSLKGLDLQGLLAHAKENLPKYAVPVFIRETKKQTKTSTEKVITTQLKKEGVDPSKVDGDKIYWLQGDKYVPFKKADWEALENGKKSI
ncbi:hypothetical protein E5Q_04704 [Mixia osmundae IAM 14324]|uniref:Very long-chain fatty acid transport protein n=1 Tax=Mixia osmundae (strain CBS 9802 / IAM 14324 / JCM 22182 / KY 12970) TaxID=764103 RepID=G7E5B4_MIXOS|nr:hypothetical protein E5Q_04704 [Mixia osmundae IAM 14324]